MIYKVKRVNNDNQKTMKETKIEVTIITKVTIYCRFYNGVKFVVKFVVVVSLISWLVSVAGMVEVEEKQQDDRCGYLMLVE